MLSAYLEQLDLRQPATPSLAFLTDLVQRHIAQYTFNNLSVLLRHRTSLEMEDIYHKLITRRAGGFCFEHNKLIMHCLNELGYNTRLVMARVLNNNVRDVPRTHRFTLVTINHDEYLVDGGFGASVPPAPLRVNHHAPQRAGGKDYQIVPTADGEFDLVELRQGEPFVLYRFDRANYSDADCTAAHFYSTAHPQAVFVNNLVVSITAPDQSYALVNHQLTSTVNGQSETLTVTSPEQLEQILQQHFSLSTDRAICKLLFDRHVQPALLKPDTGETNP